MRPLNDGNLLCVGVNSATASGRWSDGEEGVRRGGVRYGVSARHGALGGGDVVDMALHGGMLGWGKQRKIGEGYSRLLECEMLT
mgnify:CR=1 FL=1